jgi:hypothetical protein
VRSYACDVEIKKRRFRKPSKTFFSQENISYNRAWMDKPRARERGSLQTSRRARFAPAETRTTVERLMTRDHSRRRSFISTRPAAVLIASEARSARAIHSSARDARLKRITGAPEITPNLDGSHIFKSAVRHTRFPPKKNAAGLPTDGVPLIPLWGSINTCRPCRRRRHARVPSPLPECP